MGKKVPFYSSIFPSLVFFSLHVGQEERDTQKKKKKKAGNSESYSMLVHYGEVWDRDSDLCFVSHS